jgi:hypothetical protein
MNPSKNATDQKKLKLAAPVSNEEASSSDSIGKRFPGSRPESDGNDRLTPMLWEDQADGFF